MACGAVLSQSTRALKNRNFRVFFVGQVVSTVGSWMQMLAQAWLVLQVTGSGRELGVVLALQTLPILVIGAWGGVVADRIDNRRLLMLTAIAGTLQAIGMGVMQASGQLTIHWLYLFAFVLGVITAFDRPAMQAMNYELVEPGDLSSAVGIAGTVNSAGRLLGPALAGVVIATAGMATVFFVNAVTFAAVLVALAMIPAGELFQRTSGSTRARLRDGLSYVWRQPTLRLAMLVMFIVGTFTFNFATIVPSMIRLEFHGSALALGLVQAVGGVGSVLGGLAVGSLVRPTTRLLGLVAVGFGVCVALGSVAPSVAVFALVWFPLGFAASAFTAVDQSILQREAAPEYQGRVMSLFTIAWMGTTPIGALISGNLVDRWSPRAAMAVGAIAALIAGLVALAVWRRAAGRGSGPLVPADGLVNTVHPQPDCTQGVGPHVARGPSAAHVGGAAMSASAKVREQIGHPVIDCDGHWFEPLPVFMDFLRDTGGPEIVDAFRGNLMMRNLWYERTPDERKAWRQNRPSGWIEPGTALDRATTDLPGLLYDRLDEMGIDFAVLYPSLGLGSVLVRQEDLRRAWVRAANNMTAELFAPYADRLAPVAIVPTQTPEEAIEELEYVRTTLGMKAMFIDGNIRRPVPALAANGEKPQAGISVLGVPYYLDSLGLDSAYDYDPLWAKAVELGVAVTAHGGSMSWPDRTSPTNFVFNHIGHFANAGHAAAKALFLGGVTRRFPTLNFAFLEGGVSYACQLYLDLIRHWRKRNADAMRSNLAPTNVDFSEMRALYDKYGGDRIAGRFDEMLASPSRFRPFKSAEEIVAEEPSEGEMSFDDFEALGITDEESLKAAFRERFWFGCEADDPGAGWAFDKRLDMRLQPAFSSDIGHFDVTDMSEVLEEAYELVDLGLLDEADFKRFTFTNTASLHAGMNPDFYKGTVVEDAVAAESRGGTASS